MIESTFEVEHENGFLCANLSSALETWISNSIKNLTLFLNEKVLQNNFKLFVDLQRKSIMKQQFEKSLIEEERAAEQFLEKL